MDDTPDAASAKKAVETAVPVSPPDRHIWGIYLALVVISIVELYSASSREVTASGILGIYGPIVRHGVMLLMGLVIILLLQRVHYRKFLKWIPLFAFASVVMMTYVMFFGEEVNGARRSLPIFGISLQPSEFIKLSAAAMVALILQMTQTRGGVTRKGVIATAIVIVVFTILLMPQGLTNTLLLLSISVAMMIIGGVPLRYLADAGAILIAFIGLLLGLHFLMIHLGHDGFLGRFDVWIERITNHIGDGTPEYTHKITSENAQQMYSYMAQAHGGITGVLPGNSREAARLPLAFSDYIYSIIVEDLGLIGGLAVIMLYLWLLGRASVIAGHCSRAFPALLVLGMALVIVFQALFHIAIVTGAFPVSGQPLPLISKGGTSILVTSIAFGVMLSVSRYAVRNGQRKDINRELEMLPEDARADNPAQIN